MPDIQQDLGDANQWIEPPPAGFAPPPLRRPQVAPPPIPPTSALSPAAEPQLPVERTSAIAIDEQQRLDDWRNEKNLSPPGQPPSFWVRTSRGWEIQFKGGGQTAPPAANEVLGRQRGPTPQDVRDPEKARDQVVSFWMSNGAPEQVAQGIADRVQAESGFNPTNVGDNGTSFGLYQHHEDRAVRLMKFASRMGKSPGDPAVQNAFALSETKGGDPTSAAHWQEILSAPDRQTAAHLWDKYFERSAGSKTQPSQLYQMGEGFASEDRARYQEGFSRQQDLIRQYQTEAAKADPDSAERRTALLKAREARASAELHYAELEKVPPAYKPADLWEQFGSPMMIIAALGGLFSRQHATAALNAAGSAMMAQNQGRWDQFQIARDQWKSSTEAALMSAKLAAEDINSLLAQDRLTYEEKNARLKQILDVHGMEAQDLNAAATHQLALQNAATAAQYRKDRLDQVMDLQGPKAEEQKIKLQNYHNAVAAKEQEWLQHHPDQTDVPNTEKSRMETEAAGEAGIVSAATAKMQLDPKIAAFQAFRREHPDATAEQMQGFLQQQYQSRSPMGQILSKYREAYPNATAQDLVGFYAGAQQTISASRYFSSGQAERVLRSFNAVAQHLDVYRDLMAAMQNGDIQLINRARARFQQETGQAAPNNAALASKLLSGEISKAVQGGVGALADREAIQDPLSRANSPEQVLGIISTAQSFVKGQFDSLKQTYDATGMGSVQPFETRLTPAAKKLFGMAEGKAQSTGGEQSIPLPPGAKNDPDGTGYRKGDQIWVKRGDQLVLTPGGTETAH